MNKLGIQHWYAWAGGFLEGEGCFQLQKMKGHADYVRCMRISAGQRKIQPLQKLQQLFGGKIREQQKMGRPMYVWVIDGGAGALSVLPHVMPYLIGKREEAEALLAFARTYRGPMGPAKLDNDVITHRLSLIERHRMGRLASV